MKWLYDNWPKSTIFSAIYIMLLLVLFVLKADYALFLIWAQMCVYLLHQFEEYIFPGGFKEYFNINVLGSENDQEPLNKAVAFWINVPVIYIAYPVTAVLAQFAGPGIGMWTAYFSVINAAGHVVMGIRDRGYNPGFVVSLFVNIPFGIYTIWYMNSNELIGAAANIAGLVIGLLVQGVVMFYGFAILKPKMKKMNNMNNMKNINK
jgi:hypothetical protein